MCLLIRYLGGLAVVDDDDEEEDGIHDYDDYFVIHCFGVYRCM